jgi:hypothetical protein
MFRFFDLIQIKFDLNQMFEHFSAKFCFDSNQINKKLHISESSYKSLTSTKRTCPPEMPSCPKSIANRATWNILRVVQTLTSGR